MTRNAPALIGLSVVAAACIYLVAGEVAGGAGDGHGEMRIATGLGLLIVIVGAALMSRAENVSAVMTQAVCWSAGLAAIAVVYAYRTDFIEAGLPVAADFLDLQVVARETPAGGRARAPLPGQAVVSAGRGGQFYVEALVNGRHIQFVADTGATLVALTAEDAERLGLHPGTLDYRFRHQTANGIARTAHVVLGEVAVGPITIAHVPASVSEPGNLQISLLGMSFLKELSSFHIRGDQLVLEQ